MYATTKETALLDTRNATWNFNGYYREERPTLLPLNALTYQTTNVCTQMVTKLYQERLLKVLGQKLLKIGGIIGHKKYKNQGRY